ncbi:GNAT family N-acetyltransferase [Ramlibacter solisilvae]|uniref:GCN5 family acetyltransferase n=1 Tax=Ramlibacter tataouinensis TaxID=94132 RepID=A0A127JT21_9BURK|nr:GNAT family N-acetyltransferase [Ramlibacter tataouinensis]AMO23151.1 GCN5 family acetyltransferase [Ramlibacter tataouinensis]
MEIRRLGLRDAADYRTLRLRSFMEHPEAFTTSYEELERQSLQDTEKRLAALHMKLWGAFRDGKLCGYVGLDRETRVKSRHKATLVGMYVEPEFSGRGTGRALIQALLREARADGIELVVLTVTEGDGPAARLYERCGFRSFGVEPRAIKVGGRYYAKKHMYIELGAAS